MPATTFSSTRLIALGLIAVLALGWNLGGHRFLDPDEGRNGEVAREMAATRDYLVPHLDGLPYLDKPVVYFAAAAVSMTALGTTETAARLPAYIFTIATILLVTWFARRRWGVPAGWLAGIALATMPLTLAYARTTIFDSTLTCFVTAAILAFYEDRPLLAWAAIGAGALTKGPVAILIPLATLIPYRLLTGLPVRRLFAWRALLVFGLVALPWFLAVTARIPEFPHYVFIRETLQRVTTRSFHRTGPWWYYLPILPVAAFPWTVPALARLGGGAWRWAWLARRVNPAAREPIFLACWVLGPLLFFSLNQSKLPQYVLPLTPALALAAARNLVRDRIATAGARAYLVTAAIFAAALLTFDRWLMPPTALTPAERQEIPHVAQILGAMLVVSAVGVVVAARRNNLTLAAAAYALVILTVPWAGSRLMRAVGEDRSAGPLADAIRTAGEADVLLVGAYPTSLPFYLRRRLPIATKTAEELTSNWIQDQAEHYRTLPGSPLLPADAWHRTATECRAPTIFVVEAGNRAVRDSLSRLPVLYEDDRYAALGPCSPARVR